MTQGSTKIRLAKGPSQLRIIGGAWRGRRLPVLSQDGLRPTPDRVRETLFNWLQSLVAGSRCLDLFAGSGALGLEALSRGAAQTTLVDSNRSACKQILLNLQQLDTDNADVLCSDAMSWLDHYRGPGFDIIFLDPPFHGELAEPVMQRLQSRAAIRPGARVYVEQSIHEATLTIPPDWQILRDKTAGQVRYRLLGVPSAQL